MAVARRIVVDASVARSAGNSPVPGLVSSPCRAVLDAILEGRHRIALSENEEEETVEWISGGAGPERRRWLGPEE